MTSYLWLYLDLLSLMYTTFLEMDKIQSNEWRLKCCCPCLISEILLIVHLSFLYESLFYWLVYIQNKKNLSCFFSGGGYSGNQENRYVGFGNTVTPEKKEEDFLNNAMSSIYSVSQDTLFWGGGLNCILIFFSFLI